jgi:hypothetical protein
MEKMTKINPPRTILQLTSHAGSTPLFSNRNWAQVPEMPQKIADDSAIRSPGNF